MQQKRAEKQGCWFGLIWFGWWWRCAVVALHQEPHTVPRSSAHAGQWLTLIPPHPPNTTEMCTHWPVWTEQCAGTWGCVVLGHVYA